MHKLISGLSPQAISLGSHFSSELNIGGIKYQKQGKNIKKLLRAGQMAFFCLKSIYAIIYSFGLQELYSVQAMCLDPPWVYSPRAKWWRKLRSTFGTDIVVSSTQVVTALDAQAALAADGATKFEWYKRQPKNRSIENRV